VRGEEYAKAACLLYQEKLVKYGDIAENCWYFFEAPVEGEGERGVYNSAAVDKLLLNNADAPVALGELHGEFAALSSWDAATLEACVDGFCERSGLGRGKVMQPWRVALTGDKMSPGFYDVLVVLGKDEVLARVKPWVERLAG
jgi:glutamyl/glutaminyl-tRNA synthetase